MLMVRENFINATKGHRLTDDRAFYVAFTNDKRRLFRSLQKEFGKCVSKMYVDTDKGALPCGYVFQKKMEYVDTGRYGRPIEYYIQEAWIEIQEVND